MLPFAPRKNASFAKRKSTILSAFLVLSEESAVKSSRIALEKPQKSMANRISNTFKSPPEMRFAVVAVGAMMFASIE